MSIKDGNRIELKTEITLTDLLNFNGIDDLNEHTDRVFLDYNGDDVSVILEDICYTIVGYTDNSIKIKIHGTVREL